MRRLFWLLVFVALIHGCSSARAQCKGGRCSPPSHAGDCAAGCQCASGGPCLCGPSCPQLNHWTPARTIEADYWTAVDHAGYAYAYREGECVAAWHPTWPASRAWTVTGSQAVAVTTSAAPRGRSSRALGLR